VAKVGTSKADGTISQQAAVHPWLAADAQGNKQTNKHLYTTQHSLFTAHCMIAVRESTAYLRKSSLSKQEKN
jgi:hypothetical protein